MIKKGQQYYMELESKISKFCVKLVPPPQNLRGLQNFVACWPQRLSNIEAVEAWMVFNREEILDKSKYLRIQNLAPNPFSRKIYFPFVVIHTT